MYRTSQRTGKGGPSIVQIQGFQNSSREMYIWLLSYIRAWSDPYECLAAWDFYNKHKNSVKWDLSVINPPFVSLLLFRDLCMLIRDVSGLWSKNTLSFASSGFLFIFFCSLSCTKSHPSTILTLQWPFGSKQYCLEIRRIT